MSGAGSWRRRHAIYRNLKAVFVGLREGRNAGEGEQGQEGTGGRRGGRRVGGRAAWPGDRVREAGRHPRASWHGVTCRMKLCLVLVAFTYRPRSRRSNRSMQGSVELFCVTFVRTAYRYNTSHGAGGSIMPCRGCVANIFPSIFAYTDF